MNPLAYILTSSLCLCLCFLLYKFIYRNESNFRQLRFFLLASVFISLLLPFNTMQIRVGLSLKRNMQKTVFSSVNDGSAKFIAMENAVIDNDRPAIKETMSKGSLAVMAVILKVIYTVVAIFLIIRFLLQLVVLVVQYAKAEKTGKDHLTLIYNSDFNNTFSFFSWVFVHSDPSSTDDMDEIIAHEKVHVAQLHSIDIIVIELLSAVMWFNPVVWMIRKEMQLVHEYLADEGALSTGIDRLRYQALLVNQITEEKLIRLSSSFNHSLIKKRMIMMTKSKFNQQTKLKIIALIPLAAVIFLGIACVNGQDKSKVVTAVEPVKMNVLYIGVDNPVKIAASGYKTSALDVSIDNGTITGENGVFIARPKSPGSAVITVSRKEKTIQQTEFRVKVIPDPIAAILISNKVQYRGEDISKKQLQDLREVVAYMPDFDFNLSFEIIEFKVGIVKEGFYKTQTSYSNEITPEQRELIKQVDVKGERGDREVFFTDIKCKGPDGSIRELAGFNHRLVE